MEKTLDFIWRRRSVREFTGAPVTEEQVQSLLEAAMAAPSACCKDPWEFIVLPGKGDAENRFGMPAERPFPGKGASRDHRLRRHQASPFGKPFLSASGLCGGDGKSSACGIRPRTRSLLAWNSSERRTDHSPAEAFPLPGAPHPVRGNRRRRSCGGSHTAHPLQSGKSPQCAGLEKTGVTPAA